MNVFLLQHLGPLTDATLVSVSATIKLTVPPWLWIIIFQVAGNVAVWVTVVAHGDFDDMPDALRVIFMLLSPFYAFVECVEANSHDPYSLPFFGMLTAIIATCVLFVFFLPLIVQAFRLHRRPDDADAVKMPTSEMMKK